MVTHRSEVESANPTAIRGRDVQAMFASIAPAYDHTNSVLSMGIHYLWRRAVVRMVPRNSQARVLDVCCGTGALFAELHTRFGQIVGTDFCLPMVRLGIERMRRGSMAPTPMLQSDALALPFQSESFDVVSVAFGVRNLERLDDGVQELRRVLKPGGALLVLEFGQPRGIVAAPFRLYSKYVMPLIGGLLTGNRAAYAYLPETSRRFPCGDEFSAILRRGGFQRVESTPLTFGVAYGYAAWR